jgi:hypothetical protein
VRGIERRTMPHHLMVVGNNYSNTRNVFRHGGLEWLALLAPDGGE